MLNTTSNDILNRLYSSVGWCSITPCLWANDPRVFIAIVWLLPAVIGYVSTIFSCALCFQLFFCRIHCSSHSVFKWTLFFSSVSCMSSCICYHTSHSHFVFLRWPANLFAEGCCNIVPQPCLSLLLVVFYLNFKPRNWHVSRSNWRKAKGRWWNPVISNATISNIRRWQSHTFLDDTLILFKET